MLKRILLTTLFVLLTAAAGTGYFLFAGDYVRERGGKQLTLFTNSEKNISFYTKCGFETFHKCDIAHDGKTMGSWSVKKSV